MPNRDPEEVINEPITADEFGSDDLPEEEAGSEALDADLGDVGDEDLEGDVGIGDDEIDPIGDLGMEDDLGLGGGGDLGMDDEEFESELDSSPEDELPEMTAPEAKVRWTPVPQENGDIWSEHVEGFVLRARPLSAQQGPKIKYAVQLFKNDQMVEKGVIYIDRHEDAREYLQNIADRILDRMNLINLSQVDATPGEEFDEVQDSELETAADTREDIPGLAATDEAMGEEEMEEDAIEGDLGL